MPRRRISRFEASEQPMNWGRAIFCGMVGAAMFMGFLDIFNTMGRADFSLEVYIGSLFTDSRYDTHAWTLGFFANLFLGGLFGIFYAYCFEFVFKAAGARVGLIIGFFHALIAAVAFFPFFNTIHEFMRTDAYPHFGFFGSGMGGQTVLLLFIGHLLFGVAAGTFYGPVRVGRVRSRVSEPGESGLPGDVNTIPWSEDMIDRHEESSAGGAVA